MKANAEVIDELLPENYDRYPLWQMDIRELAGRNIETKGREDVNEMLMKGWVLLHIYTLKYREDGEWRERPMAILGRPKFIKKAKRKKTDSGIYIKIP